MLGAAAFPVPTFALKFYDHRSFLVGFFFPVYD